MRARFGFVGILMLCASLSGMTVSVQAEQTPTPGDPEWEPQPAEVPDDDKLRIIVFGAHPDDAEINAGGVGAMWAEQGHHVKFVSMTNGDIGHRRMGGGPLAQRRTAEAQEAADALGIAESQVLDIHDGELMPDLETRRTVVQLIREWKADVVAVHRPNDYHPDHRNAGLVVRDAAFMVTVPFFRPDVPFLETNPVFLYVYDRFERPYPFQGDILVSIDDVLDTKLDAMVAMESQFIEGGCCNPQRDEEEVREWFRGRFATVADDHRDRLVELYGQEHGQQVQHAEAFEIAEHGHQPSDEELRDLFPFDGLWEE